MIKNKLDFKLINITLIIFIMTLFYLSSNLWQNIISKILEIVLPFLIAFSIAYSLYPIVEKLRKYKIPKFLSIIITLIIVIGLFVLIIALLMPLLFEQLESLFNGIMIFIKQISIKYNLDLNSLLNVLSDSFNEFIGSFSKWISTGTLNVISSSINYISTFIITLSVTIYFLFDMDKIKLKIKNIFRKKGIKSYNYIKTIDESLQKYLNGFTKIVIISFFEYTIFFLIISHPNALLLGLIAALGNLIPYFGGIITNIIALITASVVSFNLFIKTLIIFIILSIVDGYIINPFVYGKSNNIEPVLVIFSVFSFGILFGIMGVIISLPVTIIIISTYKYYKKDIEEKLKKNNTKKTLNY